MSSQLAVYPVVDGERPGRLRRLDAVVVQALHDL